MSVNKHANIYFTVFGSISGTTRTSVELESTYQATEVTEAVKAFRVDGRTRMNLDILYTMGGSETSNSIEIKVEGSPDGTNYYRLPNESVSAGTSTVTAREYTFVGVNGAATTISISQDIFYKFIKVSAKETGVSSNKGSIYGEVTLVDQ